MDLLALLVEGSLKLPMLWTLLVQPHVRKFHWGLGVSSSSHVKTIKRLVRKAGFSKEFEYVVSNDFRKCTACLCQGQWSRSLQWCQGQRVDPRKATILKTAEFFLYLHWELKLSVPAVIGYISVLNHVFFFDWYGFGGQYNN